MQIEVTLEPARRPIADADEQARQQWHVSRHESSRTAPERRAPVLTEGWVTNPIIAKQSSLADECWRQRAVRNR